MPRAYSKEIKQRVRNLKGRGWSLGEISQEMKIPKNTLSGWVKDIQLTKKQKNRIRKKIIASGATGRPLAVKWMREKIESWKNEIRNKIKHFSEMPLQNPEIGRLICGLLYLCEGAKYPSSRYLHLGNSDPKIISAFLTLLRMHYNIDETKLRFDIGYRCDQNYEELKSYWSKITGIPKSQCLRSQPDTRTKGKPTLRKDYKGVCRIIYYDTCLQFELQSISEMVVKNGAEGS